MSFILFYSDFCQHCAKFMKILENSGQAMYFVKIPVDRDRRTKKRSEYVSTYGIKEVPTIIIESSALAGINAFQWLINRIESSASAANSVSTRQNKITNADHPGLRAENSGQQILAANAVGNEHAGNQGGEPEAYSLTDAGNSNFLQLSDMGNTAIETPPETDDIQKPSNFILRSDTITAQAMNTAAFPQQQDPNKPRLTVRKDALKEKQLDNQYSKLLEERRVTVPAPPQMRT